MSIAPRDELGILVRQDAMFATLDDPSLAMSPADGSKLDASQPRSP